jgi:hypothetical protein
LGGGLGYLGTLAATGGNTGAAKAVQEGIGNALTYQPRTEAGQADAQALGDVTSLMGQKEGDIAGPWVAEKTGSPLAGAAVNTLANVPQFLLGARAGKGVTAKLPELNKPSGIVDVIKGNANNIADNYVRSITGNPNTRRVLAGTLEQSGSSVPGYQVTAAEAVSHLPEGTPIQALEQAVSSSHNQLPDGGPAISQAFNQRLSTQEAVRTNLLTESISPLCRRLWRG